MHNADALHYGFHPFGVMPDGEPILAAHIASEALEAKVVTLGAVLADLRIRLPGETRRVVLGFDEAQPYLHHSPHIGAIAGRYGGRIRDGRLAIDGRVIELGRNAGAHHAHGGHGGFGKRNWKAVEAGPSTVTLALHSPDGDEGYPGTLTARCTISLQESHVWIDLTAHTDAPTPVNLLHHGYFNLDGAGDIAGHRLTIPASAVVESAEDGCPTGRFVGVEGPFDFRRSRSPEPSVAYDVSYLLDEAGNGATRLAARLESTAGDLAMEVWTSEPGLHFYDGHKLDVPVPGHAGALYRARHGLCLETTRFADAPNHPGFPDTILRPGALYHQRTEFRFVVPDPG